MNVVDGCDDSATTFFQTKISVEFAGDVDAVTNLELVFTEDGTRMTYNQLAAELCDPLVRRMVNATFEEITPVPAELSREPSYRVRFAVVGNCRGCAADTPLFSDASNARRALKAEHNKNQRQMEDVNGCPCPVGATGLERSPNTGEYTVAYNEWLERAHDGGRVNPDNIARTLNTVELGNTDSTSAAFHTGRVRGTDVGNILFVALVMLKMIM